MPSAPLQDAAVLAYLACYTHRVAISGGRLVARDDHGVTFRYKDYRAKDRTGHKAMPLEAAEFLRRRFLLHVLPRGFHPHPPRRTARQHATP